MTGLSGTGSPRTIAPELLRWWRRDGRKDLPWQRDQSPYRVWISEIMLQQTQVATVERYYERFMTAFPDVVALADTQADEVLHLWSGLGYYSRARNLHCAARIVRDEFGGTVPADFDALISLPGIGRSTAGAILALSLGKRYPILDGNARRVLARVHCVEGWPGVAAVNRRLWELAEACTPAREVAEFTQAIMDLGATLCTHRRPACTACPLTHRCAANAVGAVGRIPASRPRKRRPLRSTVIAIAVAESAVLLEKRPPTGIWGGLWSFPELPDTDAIDAWCAAHFGQCAGETRTWPVVRHSFSHFDLDMTPVEIRIDRRPQGVMEGDRWLWYNTRAPAEIGLAAPVAKLLQAFGERR